MVEMNRSASRPELLAPAGDAAAALAAFEAGADAVYAGLPRFNARERNPNFDFDAMARLIGYARERNRRVYVTFNTLLREEELPEAAEYLYRLTTLRPDAVIVQDLGLIRLAREYFPALTLHGSTQMGIHNSAGVAASARLGLKRVILERQVTMTELAQLMPRAGIEIEVFVHGALCCSLSGVCLFSSWNGGWSGNRGKCKQSCRREYAGADGRRGNYFSPTDLCLLEQIPELCRLGVASFKIEGRLRRADYVRNAVAAYRLAIDAAGAGEPLPDEAGRLLRRAGGRTWSTGFASAEAMAKLIQPYSPGVAGQAVGRVDGIRRDGVAVTATGRLHRGDRVRMLAPDGNRETVFTLTAMTDEHGAPVVRLQGGRRGWLKVAADKIIPGAALYKVGESCAASTDAVLAGIPLPRHSLDLTLVLTDGTLEVDLPGLPAVPLFRISLETLPALKKPLRPETVAEAFAVSNSARLCAGHTMVRVPEGIFVPAGELKRARQEFWRWAEATCSDFELNAAGAAGLARFAADYGKMTPPVDGDRRPAVCGGSGGSGDVIAVVSSEQWSGGEREEILLPFFVPENELASWRRRIAGLLERGARRFRVTSLFWFELLRGCGELQLTSSFPLPAANSAAAAALAALGCFRVQAWVEMNSDDLEAWRRKAPVVPEYYRRGRVPLLVTRARIPVSGGIADERQNRFEVVKRGALTVVLPIGPLEWPGLPELAEFEDRRETGDGGAGRDFNYSGHWA